MKLILPEVIDDAALIATNVPETLDLYDPDAIYIGGNQVRDDTAHHAYESAIGVAPAVVSISIATPAVVSQTAHGLTNGMTVLFQTTGSLPTGLVANTIYYVVNRTDNTYEVAATAGGASIDTSGGQSGTQTVIASPNKGYPLTDQSKWIDLGPTNPWAMFDQKLGTRTSNADTIEVTVKPVGRATAMALFNLDAATVSVTVTDDAEGVVFDETFNLTSFENVTDYYDYCFEPIIRKSELLIEGLPLYVAPDIDVVIDNTGGTAACGSLVMGSLRELGATVHGSGFGIIDSSRKEADDFGSVDLVERAYRSTATLEVVVDRFMVDEVKRVLTSRRAKPTVYIGTDLYDGTLIYGFPRNWSVNLDQPLTATLTADMESLS